MASRLTATLVAARSTVTSTPVVAGVLAVLAWPVDTLVKPGSVYYDGWPSALYFAAHGDFHWGSDIAYTYGPLGFMRLPIVYFPATTRLSLLYVAITLSVLSASLLFVLRRAFGIWVAAGLTLLALCLVSDERVTAAAFVWGVLVLRNDRPRLVGTVFALAIGFAGALEMLVKFNSGVAVLAIGLVVAVTVPGRRLHDLGLLVGSFVASFLVLWLIAGQRLGDLGSYAVGTKEIVAGYAATLGGGDRYTNLSAIAALLTLGLVLLAAWRANPPGGRRARWAVLALVAIAGFVLFKEGFVRSDTAHRPLFFGFALCALLAVAAERRLLWRLLPAAAALALATAWSYQASPLSATAPGSEIGAGIKQLRVSLSSRAFARSAAQQRTRLRRRFRIDRQTLANVGHHSMTILPWAYAAAYAYHLRWQPLYTIQPTQGYTSWLDERQARILRSRRGPERILRSPGPTLDRRDLDWDMPATTRTMLCRYAQVSANRRWQVLARSGDHCGGSRTIATIRARWGETIAVPRPPANAVMFVRIHGVEPHGLETLLSLAYRPLIRHVILNHRSFRLVPGTAGDGLVLWVPPGADYSPPFELSRDPRSLTIRKGFGGQPSSGRVTYQFEATRIAPFGRSPA